MSILIKGGRVITAADDYVGDVFVEDERISLIGESLDVEADRVVDATGKYVLPGRDRPSHAPTSTCPSPARIPLTRRGSGRPRRGEQASSRAPR
jgi:cytosine/adenosine deaminase-related metal-dependent hydrolase